MRFDTLRTKLFGHRPKPDLQHCTVADILSMIQSSPADEAATAASNLLYQTQQRPPDLSDQLQLFEEMSQIQTLPFDLRLNAMVAAGHKALESGAGEAIFRTAARLAHPEILAQIVAQPSDGNIRRDPAHFFFSRSYVLFNCALWQGDQDAMGDLAGQVGYWHLNEANLTTSRNLYRTFANMARCLGFCAHTAWLHQPDLLAALARTGVDLSQQALQNRGATPAKRHTDRGVPFPDIEFLAACRIIALVESLAHLTDAEPTAGDAIVRQIGDLAVAQRTPEQKARLLSQWTARSRKG